MSSRGLVALSLALGLCCGSGSAAAGTAGVVYMTPDGRPGYEPGATAPKPALAYSSASFEHLPDGTRVQLLPSVAGPQAIAVFASRVVLDGKRDITVRGLGSRTVIRGRSLEEIRNCPPPPDGSRGCGPGATTPARAVAAGKPSSGRSHLAALLDAAPGGHLLAPRAVPPGTPGTGSRLREAACIDVVHSEGIAFEALDFDGCWLAAIRATGSRRIALRRAVITGSSYGLVLRGARPGEDAANRAGGVTVEDVRWIQDTSAYAGDPREGACKPGRAWAGACPGDMWRKLPWGVAHHGAYEHLNGALLAGTHLTGDVVFRRNTIENAYNGIRLTARACPQALGRTDAEVACRYNANLWIYDNTFSYLRDNPIELEDVASEAHIFRNHFRNAHAWLSFDGATGGPVYVHGNVGWFDDRPSVAWSDALESVTCRKTLDTGAANGELYDSRLDRRFDYGAGTWNAVGVAVYRSEAPVWLDPVELSCAQSTSGRVIKIGMPDPDSAPDAFDRYPYFSRGPLYVFNNSWFVRAPITGIGMALNLKHWNNAILFCEPGVPGYRAGLCARPHDPATSDPRCGPSPGLGLMRYWAEEGSLPFFDCFRWYPIDSRGRELRDLPNQFDHDVSSNGFPLVLQQAYGMEANGRHADPGFVAPHRGDLRLKEGAAAASSACSVEDDGHGGLACLADGAARYAGAFAPDGTPYPGPPGARFRPPR